MKNIIAKKIFDTLSVSYEGEGRIVLVKLISFLNKGPY
jgi:hypothetical protein